MKQYDFLCITALAILILSLSACQKEELGITAQDVLSSAPNYQTVTEPQQAQPVYTVEIDSEIDSPTITEYEDENGSNTDNNNFNSNFIPNQYNGYDAPIPPPPPPEDDDFFYEDDLFLGAIPFKGVCGNGKREAEEQCDDGNEDNTDGCNILCKLPTCGNGVIELGENCDDNNRTSGDGCNIDCNFEVCGNGCIDANEMCDDGNLISGDGCSKACMPEFCGNDLIDAQDPNNPDRPREECDDGNWDDGDGCDKFCQLEP